MGDRSDFRAMHDRRSLCVAAAGLAAGALSAFLFSVGNQRLGWVAPGATFGVVLGAAMYFLHVAGLRKAALFAVASEASWYAAYWFALKLFEWIGNSLKEAEGKMVLIGLAAGALGAILLAGGTAALFPWFRSWRRISAATAVGAVTGMLIGLDWGNGYPLFVVWQGSFALCLALAFPPEGDIL